MNVVLFGCREDFLEILDHLLVLLEELFVFFDESGLDPLLLSVCLALYLTYLLSDQLDLFKLRQLLVSKHFWNNCMLGLCHRVGVASVL